MFLRPKTTKTNKQFLLRVDRYGQDIDNISKGKNYLYRSQPEIQSIAIITADGEDSK